MQAACSLGPPGGCCEDPEAMGGGDGKSAGPGSQGAMKKLVHYAKGNREELNHQ